ncbi:NlpC/P60 family protein [Amycolatopsis suaedae]|uniref:NlpC/P60 family protein n=2 Tax=Amycolatopsis suaedae TaxID=2510978 RepID=A0A4Q7J828_9PSEU|nr:NlpC/P60 family protein [Amycolatopsis suaedae]
MTSAVDGQAALRTQLDGVHGNVSAQRANLAANSSGHATDNATNTSVSLEKEVTDLLQESAEIEKAVAEAAEILDVADIKNQQLREEIIQRINTDMKAIAALRASNKEDAKGQIAKIMAALVAFVEEKNGESATVAASAQTDLTTTATKLAPPASNPGTGGNNGGSGGTVVGGSFNSRGGGRRGGGGGGGGGGGARKPRLPVAIPPQPGTGVDVNLPDGSTVKAPNETAAKAVRAALSNLGVPYVWGGTSPGVGLDCSGLTMTSYGEAGLEIPRKSNQQTVGAEVPSMDQLLPGDLVVWSGHVAMVIGNGQMIEAGDPVQVGPIRTTNAGQSFIGFYRPTG